jgi:hypothetical protein
MIKIILLLMLACFSNFSAQGSMNLTQAHKALSPWTERTHEPSQYIDRILKKEEQNLQTFIPQAISLLKLCNKKPFHQVDTAFASDIVFYVSEIPVRHRAQAISTILSLLNYVNSPPRIPHYPLSFEELSNIMKFFVTHPPIANWQEYGRRMLALYPHEKAWSAIPTYLKVAAHYKDGKDWGLFLRTVQKLFSKSDSEIDMYTYMLEYMIQLPLQGLENFIASLESLTQFDEHRQDYYSIFMSVLRIEDSNDREKITRWMVPYLEKSVWGNTISNLLENARKNLEDWEAYTRRFQKMYELFQSDIPQNSCIFLITSNIDNADCYDILRLIIPIAGKTKERTVSLDVVQGLRGLNPKDRVWAAHMMEDMMPQGFWVHDQNTLFKSIKALLRIVPEDSWSKAYLDFTAILPDTITIEGGTISNGVSKLLDIYLSVPLEEWEAFGNALKSCCPPLDTGHLLNLAYFGGAEFIELLEAKGWTIDYTSKAKVFAIIHVMQENHWSWHSLKKFIDIIPSTTEDLRLNTLMSMAKVHKDRLPEFMVRIKESFAPGLTPESWTETLESVRSGLAPHPPTSPVYYPGSDDDFWP